MITGCNSEVKGFVNKTDSLLTEANNIKEKIDALKLDTITGYFKKIKNIDKRLTTLLKGFPETEFMKKKILQFGDVEKGFKKIPEKVKEMKYELSLSIKQLTSLKHDLENDLLSKDEMKEYFSEEKETFNELSGKINRTVDVLNMYIDNYKNLKPKIISYADSLEQAITNK